MRPVGIERLAGDVLMRRLMRAQRVEGRAAGRQPAGASPDRRPSHRCGRHRPHHSRRPGEIDEHRLVSPITAPAGCPGDGEGVDAGAADALSAMCLVTPIRVRQRVDVLLDHRSCGRGDQARASMASNSVSAWLRRCAARRDGGFHGIGSFGSALRGGSPPRARTSLVTVHRICGPGPAKRPPGEGCMAPCPTGRSIHLDRPFPLRRARTGRPWRCPSASVAAGRSRRSCPCAASPHRSPMRRALAMSWVMETAVAPGASTTSTISPSITAPMMGSRPVVGSSKR